MPAFFSRVFSRGKDKEKGKDGLKEPGSPTGKQSKRASRASAQSLLEGKFEAVSPSVSPSVERYEEKDHAMRKEKEKERLGLFRPKSRTASGGDAARKAEDVPQLTLDLNLSGLKGDSKKRDLSIVYEGDFILDDEVLGEKRLSLAEALKLIRACLPVLTSRGLETLGIMHPHWHSASPATQRKIISLFISSLATGSENSVTSPTSPSLAFESELEYVRSPHDVAAVFRWALRHLKLDGDTFDKENTPSLAWYDNFTEKEKKDGYPRTAYSDVLLPTVKPLHAELLNSTLNLVSKLASHSEANGVSGSKLSMFFGHYLLTGNRVENLEDWVAFYSQWERAGRALEHIFLASLRDEDAKTGIPRRLSELITGYPYSKNIADGQFPRPLRFATRSYDALYIRVSAEVQPGKRSREEVYLPLQIVENALKSDAAGLSDDAELVALWEELRKKSSVGGEATTDVPALDGPLASVMSDESVRILSLKSDTGKDTPTIAMFTPVPEHDSLLASPVANGKAKVANQSKSVSRQTSEETSSSPIVTDWTAFSSAGFGEGGASQSLAATLLDSDIEKTEPPKVEKRRSLKKYRTTVEKTERPPSPTDAPIRFKTAQVSLVNVDESFIDFWSDAILDSVSNAWPTFVVCQLKSDVVRTVGDKKVTWLVIEQKFVAPPPTEPSSPAPRASSPRPSVKSDGEGKPGLLSRASATFTSRKRFNFFGGSQTPASSTTSTAEKRESKGLAKGARVNELGEVIPEEKEKDVPSAKTPKAGVKTPSVKESTPPPPIAKDEPQKSEGEKAEAVAVGATALAVGAGAAAVAAEAAADALVPESEEAKAPAQDEAVKEGVDVQPTKEAEPETAPAATPEPEPVVESTPPAAETTTAAPTHPEESPSTEPVAEEPKTAPERESTHEEVVQPVEPEPSAPEPIAKDAKVAEPAAPAPEAPPVKETPIEPVVEDVAPQPPAKTAEEETGTNQGAGDSRFVEHIETPTDVRPPEPELAAEESVPEPSKEVVDVPETIQEEPSEPAAVETAAKVDDSHVETEPSAPADDKPSSVPVVEEISAPEPKKEESPVPVEEAKESAPEVVEEEPKESEAAPPSEVPSPVAAAPVKEDTPIIEEDAAPAPGEPAATGETVHVPPAVVEAPTTAGAESESTPFIEEDAAPLVEEPAVPSADEPTKVDEPSVTKVDDEKAVPPPVAEEPEVKSTEETAAESAKPAEVKVDVPIVEEETDDKHLGDETEPTADEHVGESHGNAHVHKEPEANGETVEKSQKEEHAPLVSEDVEPSQPRSAESS